MKNKFILFIFLLSFPVISMAQRHGFGGASTGRVYGKVIDGGSNKGVGFATVTVLSSADSSVVSGALTEENGDFAISKLKMGKYILRVQYVGYTPLFKSFTVSPQSSNMDLGNFILKASTAMLNTVNVTAKKAAYTMSLDKKVFDVSQSLTTKGGTAQDVLKQVPSVYVDINGDVTIRNGTPKIYVNGKSTTLKLDQIPAETIDKIEVITNPSSKYSAEGMSGILNIVLKKNRKPGMNGRVMVGGDTRGGYNFGGNLNVYKKPLNVSVSYFNHKRNNPGDISLNRENFDKSGQISSILDQDAEGKRYGQFQMGRLGIDYFMDNRNTFSLGGGIGGGSFNRKGDIHSLFQYFSGSKPDSTNNKYTKDGHDFQFIFGDFDYKHTFSKEGHEITGNVHLSKSNSGGGGYTHYKDEAGNYLIPGPSQTNNTDGDGIRFSSQVDYVNPISKTMKFEAGLKYSKRSSESVYNVYDSVLTTPKYNAKLSSDYTYDEKTYAAYAQFSQKFNKFDYQVGLRAEQYSYSGSIPSEDTTFSPETGKLRLFPSVYLTYRLSKEDQFQLNYSRRVSRPRFWQRIPYIDYSDPQNLRKGNPNLKPELTNSFELSYNKMFGKGSNFMATLYYHNTNNSIERYSEPFRGSSDTLISYSINAHANNSYGAEFTLQTPITAWWNVTANLNLFRTELTATLEDFDRKVNQNSFTWFGKVSTSAILPADFTLQLSGRYSGPQTTPQGKTYRYGGVDFAVKKSIFKKKNGTLTLSLSDIFSTNKHKSIYKEPGFFNQTRITNPKSRSLKLTFSYTFGKQNLKLFRRKSNKSSKDSGGGMRGMGGQGEY